eukprot:g11701.t1
MAHRARIGKRRTSRVLLGIGLAVGLTTLLYSSSGRPGTERRTREPIEFAVKEPSVEVKEPRRCWVFNHLNKAGGSTMKYMLQPWIDEREDMSVGLYDARQWIEGEKYAREFLAEENTLTWGAYTEGLRPHGLSDECKWFTIFRHPIPRLVSAYFYCKKSPVDGLCASSILKANETDIYTFAEHWGNFGLRQFSLAFALPEDVIAAETESQNRCVPQKGRKDCPGWYRLKLYLEGLNRKAEEQAEAAGGSPLLGSSKAVTMKDGAMLELIQPVTELLANKYAAVGILEHWDNSIRLFQHVLNLPDFDWMKASHKMGKKNGNGTFKKQENEALEKAWTDPKLKSSMLLDLVLYDHAVSVHKRQMEQYGLS